MVNFEQSNHFKITRATTVVGVQANLEISNQGTVSGIITCSEGDQTVSTSSTVSGGVSAKVPGTDTGASSGACQTYSRGTQLGGANVTIGFTYVYDPETKNWIIADKITKEEKQKVATVLEHASSFPNDGIGTGDDQELRIDVVGLEKTIVKK